MAIYVLLCTLYYFILSYNNIVCIENNVCVCAFVSFPFKIVIENGVFGRFRFDGDVQTESGQFEEILDQFAGRLD